MNSQYLSRPGQQRGAALVVAMLVFALCAALIVSMKSDFMRLYQRTANILVAEQAYAYLRGAEELAGLALLLQPTLSFVWDVLFFGRPMQPIEIAGAAIALFAIYLGSRSRSIRGQ